MKKPVTLEDEQAKNPELKLEELKTLKEWYRLQPHLPEISDELLALFFHSCYYRMEPAKITIDNYFTVRSHVPEFFADRDAKMTGTKKGKHVVRFIVLPSETVNGDRVICTSLNILDPSDFNFNDVIKSFLMAVDLDHHYKGSSKGFIICVDMSNCALGHVARLNLLSLKKILFYLQEALPVRLKGLHFINVVPFMDKILALLRPFLKKDLMENIVLHTSLESVYEIIHKDILPNDYGGFASSIENMHSEMIKLRESHQKWYNEEAKLRVDESKRVGKSKTAGDLFGIEGSFKKLDLD